VSSLDVVIRGGLHFDGTGTPPQRRDLGLRAGRVVAVSERPLDAAGARVIDAAGAWVVPGFVDTAHPLRRRAHRGPVAVRVGPSRRHHGRRRLLLDQHHPLGARRTAPTCSPGWRRCRGSTCCRSCTRDKTWSTPAGYVEHLALAPLGPNVMSFLGHSDLRTRVLGLGRAVDGRVRPTEAELAEMERWLEEALDAGYSACRR
jgi:N-acyl-D-aspartate/D-glutamate deacylase